MIDPTRSNKDLILEAQGHIAQGRLDAAQECLHSVLLHHPVNAEAHYLLALICLATDRADEGLDHADVSVRRDRAHPGYHHVQALCLARLGRIEEAISGQRRALQLRPTFGEAQVQLAELLTTLGHHAEALVAFRRAVELYPHDAALLGKVGYCELTLGRPEQGLPLIATSIRRQPNLSAQKLAGFGEALIALGHGSTAIEPLRRAVALDPANTKAWASLGEQLYLAKDDAAALECFDRVIALDPNDDAVRFMRDMVTERSADHPPDQFVAGLFDRFAPEFDRRLTTDLEYRVPAAMAELLAPWLATRTGLRVADLGCGTGLSGGFVRSHAKLLVGVDLSEKMLEQARARAIYDELACEELNRFLASRPPGAFDLVMAADVFVYVGRLEQTLQACAAALAPGGALAFSVEHLDESEGELRLARTGRYAHSCAYVERLARENGLQPGATLDLAMRKEGGQPVPGHLILFGKT